MLTYEYICAILFQKSPKQRVRISLFVLNYAMVGEKMKKPFFKLINSAEKYGRRFYRVIRSPYRVVKSSYRAINDNLVKKRNATAGSLKQCNICGHNVGKFLPAGIEEEVFKHHHIIGGGYRESCTCPYCGAGDRQRWLYYVLQKKIDLFNASGKILHLAPEKSIQKYIRQNKQIDYYTGDIRPGRAMYVIDITDIQYKDNTFDYAISNHIMEHISDEEKAVSEIKRVLKPSGKWIFSFPVCTDMKTYEDKTITSPEQRLKAYGQKDHVRLYGYDFAERYERYGLKLQIYSPKNELDDDEINKFGFIKDDIIIVATKN